MKNDLGQSVESIKKFARTGVASGSIMSDAHRVAHSGNHTIIGQLNDDLLAIESPARAAKQDIAGVVFLLNEGLIKNLCYRYRKQVLGGEGARNARIFDYEDVVQEIGLKMNYIIEQYNPEMTKFTTLLTKAIKNRVIQIVAGLGRAQRGRDENIYAEVDVAEGVQDFYGAGGRDGDPAAHAERRELSNRIAEIVEMDPVARATMNGQSRREVAERYHCGFSTISVHLDKAKYKLLGYVDRNEYDPSGVGR